VLVSSRSILISDFLQNGFVRVAQLRSRAGCPIDTHRAVFSALTKDMVSRVVARVSLERLRTPAVIRQSAGNQMCFVRSQLDYRG
jgi:hypothetical protein